MTKITSLLFLLVTMAFTSALVSAQEADDGQMFQRLGDWEVHYSAFPSTFLQPDIAALYNISRSNSQGVINISVLDATSPERSAQRVNVDGFALSIAGVRRDLSFRRHTDGDAIYYIAQIPHGKEDEYRFFITVRQGNTTEELNFRHTFYRN